ncbi:hypothetical protein KPL78_07170 [Roseomonas sp. HJA6]|uniref:DUF222 domain-containing protein n=1 Tax=Roseomonas alba TaxID=2846776 RepID=A0ABS7A5N7_9PROT|nr:hypothetical protein [Neoroseomonas alba]MBW6397618.1 hypothetical protein [Neoroseomonas alba]
MSAGVDMPAVDAETVDSVAFSARVAEEAVAAFERAAAEEAAAMRAGSAQLRVDDVLTKAREDALSAVSRAHMVASRHARVAAGPPLASTLRKTQPANRVRIGAFSLPLVGAIKPDSSFGPDDERLSDRALQVSLGVGEDLAPDERRAEAFRRLASHIGSSVATDLIIEAAEREGMDVKRLVLAGQCLVSIPMPTDEEGQRAHNSLCMHERRELDRHQGYHVVPPRDEQILARHRAWRAVIAERRADPSNYGKPSAQIEAELVKIHPAWARSLGQVVG